MRKRALSAGPCQSPDRGATDGSPLRIPLDLAGFAGRICGDSLFKYDAGNLKYDEDLLMDDYLGVLWYKRLCFKE